MECAQRGGMKNKVCWPSSCYVPWPNLIFPFDSHASLVKPYFSYQLFGPMLRPVDPILLFFGSTNRIFHTTSSNSCHVPLTQLCSHVSVLRVHEPYFSYHFFERISRPVDPASFSCKHPAHKPYFSYQLFEFIPRPVDPTLLLCNRPSGPQTLFFIPFF